jgi:hypothetical protein
MHGARVLALALLPLAGVAGAHPHSYVDQQVQLSLGLEEVHVTAVIVPSVEEGAAIYAHLDADGNGIVSPDEASDFGTALLEGMRFVVDGQEVELARAGTRVAGAEEIRSGSGAITVTAAAPVDLDPAAAHQILFEVTYGEFSHEWFVQPFYTPQLVEAFGTPALERSPEGQQVAISFGE